MFRDLARFLLSIPGICPLVRHLYLSSSTFEFNAPVSYHDPHYPISACLLHGMLTVLPGLHSLRLSHLAIDKCWHTAHDRNHPGCLRFDEPLSISDLTLDHIFFNHHTADPRLLLLRLPSLRSFHISPIYPLTSTQRSARYDLPDIPLHTFTLVFSHSYNDYISMSSYMTRIPRNNMTKILRLLNVSSAAASHIINLLHSSVGSITWLTMALGNYTSEHSFVA